MAQNPQRAITTYFWGAGRVEGLGFGRASDHGHKVNALREAWVLAGGPEALGLRM